jgi:hypothetical protein
MNMPNKLAGVLHFTKQVRLDKDEHSSLLDPFINYKNEEL